MILRKFNMIQQKNGFRNKFRHIDGEKMRLSYSIKKNIFEVTVGSLINKFKLKKRRNTLFFNDILMNYVKECEKAGYGEEIRNISEKWAISFFQRLMPQIMKKLPFDFLCNTIIAPNFKNLGYMEDIRFIKEDDKITVITKKETNIEKIGLNNLSIGFYMGMMGFIFDYKVNYIDATKTDETCTYVFRLTKEPLSVKVKDKATYDKLNYLPHVKGFTLRDALEKSIFQLKEHNRMYFRGKPVGPLENTIFHLLGNKGLILEEISQITYNYLKEIIEESSDSKEKLVLLKTLLQTMGWGIVTIVIKSDKEIILNIDNPPYGFQIEQDNWEFLIRVILGFLWMIDKRFKIKSITQGYKKLHVAFEI